MRHEAKSSSGVGLAMLTLLTSTGTLLCCVLPAIMVVLGAGAVLAGLVATFPGLIWFTQHKLYFFVFAGLMLLIAGTLRWRARNAPCPIDPKIGKACARLRKTSKIIYWASVVLYVFGVLFSYGAVYFL